MKLKFVTATLVLAGIFCAFLLSRAGGAQSSQQSVPYQGQNTNRFQMFVSPIARADTFLVDTSTGTVRQMVQNSKGDIGFSVIDNEPPISGQAATAGRYKLYFGAIVRADTFLLDTQSGNIWQLTLDSKTDSKFFRKRTVQGIE